MKFLFALLFLLKFEMRLTNGELGAVMIGVTPSVVVMIRAVDCRQDENLKSIDFFGAIDGEIGRIAIYTSHKKVKKSNQKSKSIKVMYRLNTSLLLKILKSHD